LRRALDHYAHLLLIALQLLAASAVLTDVQKMLAEWFDDKLVSLAPVAFWLARMNRWDTHTLLGATLAM
jgi:hypothetical protein